MLQVVAPDVRCKGCSYYGNYGGGKVPVTGNNYYGAIGGNESNGHGELDFINMYGASSSGY